LHTGRFFVVPDASVAQQQEYRSKVFVFVVDQPMSRVFHPALDEWDPMTAPADQCGFSAV